MPDITSQYRDIDRLAREFDAKSSELDTELGRINEAMKMLELSKNPPTTEDFKHLGKMKDKVTELVEAQKDLSKKASALKKRIDDAPTRLEKQVQDRVAAETQGMSDKIKVLHAAKVRAELSRKYQQDKELARIKVERLTTLSGQLQTHIIDLTNRINDITTRQQAVQRSQSLPVGLGVLEQRKQEILEQAKRNHEAKQNFVNTAGPDGSAAKNQLTSNLMGNVTNKLRDTGFFDIISSIERAINSMPAGAFVPTEKTFIMQQVRKNRLDVIKAMSPWESVKAQVQDGDASPKLTEECGKVSEAVVVVLNSADTFRDATRWWKSGAAARPHIDKLAAMYAAQMKFRTTRMLKEDLAAWIKTLTV